MSSETTGGAPIPHYDSRATSTAVASPVQGAANTQELTDSERLDFMIKNCAWIQWVEFYGSTYKRAQVWTQNEDEEFIVLSGDNKSFAAGREAIDAAIIAQQVKGEQHG